MEGGPKAGTVIFLDWDDTLLCSSYLSGENIRLDTDISGREELLEHLKDFETHVIAVLKLALSFGDVTVVTNAENGWVELSAKKFVPNVLPLLTQLNVISARSTYEDKYPDAPLQWKLQVFKEQLESRLESTRTVDSVLSIGDSYVEREAILKATKFICCTTKSIKLAERPSIEQLINQLQLVAGCFEDIVSHQTDLDLCMSLAVSHPPTTEIDERTQVDEEQDFGNINMEKTLHISPKAQVCE